MISNLIYTKWRRAEIYKKIRFLLPFSLPAVLFPFFSIAPATTFILMIIVILVFPLILVTIWKCPPLENSELKTSLENLAAQAQFKHGGFKRWTVMDRQLTAGIIGIFYPFRYVLFSDVLLSRFSFSSLHAVLAHEMGHNHYKHLVFLPFILAGMFVWVETFFWWIPIENLYFQIIITLFLIAFYVRYIFGFFSRLFERQADLYILKLNLPISWMIEALESVALFSGKPANAPNWHHHSLYDRIQYLKNVQQNPSKASFHDHKTIFYVTLYFIIVALLCFQLYGLA